MAKKQLPFTTGEYNERVNKLRVVMDKDNIDMIILTSMHNIAYYTGFIYCSFGRPYGCELLKIKFQQYQRILMLANLEEISLQQYYLYRLEKR